MTTKILLKIAEKLQQKGHEYYTKDEIDKTAVFWELEAIVREILKEKNLK